MIINIARAKLYLSYDRKKYINGLMKTIAPDIVTQRLKVKDLRFKI